MKVFSAFDDVKGKNGSAHAGSSKAVAKTNPKKAARKEEPSIEEKQEKIAKLKEDKDEVKVSPKSKTQAPKKELFNLTQEQNEQEELETSQKHTIAKSDLAKNDPRDPVTKQKLKDVLSKGAMNFSGSEKKVLESILAE
ncbi:MAG: hypothetical protein ACOYL6_07245 [Bacteriovoracaceae bacterium]